MSILDIRTDKTVVDMESVRSGTVALVARWNRPYRDLTITHLGRWHVTYTDGNEGYCWGDDLLFLP